MTAMNAGGRCFRFATGLVAAAALVFAACMPSFDNPIDPTDGDAVPPPPVDVKALPVQNDRIMQIVFDYAYRNAAAVVIERSAAGMETFVPVDTVFAPVTDALDSLGLADSTEYGYRLRAYNGNGFSSYTETIAARTGVLRPADLAGPDITVLHDGNPVAGFKTVHDSTLVLRGFVRDVSGIRLFTIDRDTVRVDSAGRWSYQTKLVAFRTRLALEAVDRAPAANGTRDSVTIFFDFPNPPRRAAFALKGSILTMRWQQCTDLDFAGFAVWLSPGTPVDTTTTPDHVYRSGADTSHQFTVDPSGNAFFGIAVMDSAGNFVVGENSWGHIRSRLMFRHTMVRIREGHFTEGDSVIVNITAPFYMDSAEVSQEYYERVAGYNPARFSGALRPVESVNWFDAVRFCNERSKYHGFDTVYSYTELSGVSAANLVCHWEKNGYRLPTADEWEYAARAGAGTVYLWGDSASDSLARLYSWCSANADSSVWTSPHALLHGPQAVGQVLPNAWGLRDVAGNVLEWCWDYVGDQGREKGRIDYRGPALPSCCGEDKDGPRRVTKGTAWLSSPNAPQFVSHEEYPERQRSYIVGIRTVQRADR